MKKLRIILLLLALLVLLASCGGTGGETPNVTDDSTPAVTDTTAAPETTVPAEVFADETVFASGSTNYTLVYPKKVPSAVLDAIKELRTLISTTYGIEITAGTDADIPEGEYEILIGATNRTLSTIAANHVGVNEYAVKRFENAITLQGADDALLLEAIAQFSALLDGNALVVSPDQVLAEVRYAHPVTSIELNGVDLRNYVLVHASKSGGVDFAACAEVLNNRLVDIAGYSLEIVSASKAKDLPYVISIGKSSVSPSETEPEKNSCVIGLKGTTLYLDGNTTNDMKGAIRIFMDEYLPSDASGKISIKLSDFEKTEAIEGLGRIRLLTIGNSWSNDGVEHLWNVLNDAGYTDIIIGNLYKGACTINQHWELSQNKKKEYTFFYNQNGKWNQTQNVNLDYCLKFTEWDIISLQQASTGGIELYYKELDNFYQYVVENAKQSENAIFVWHMPWALPIGSERNENIFYGHDPAKNYSMILDVTEKYILSSDKFTYMIPSGTVMQNLRSTYIGEGVFRDNVHASHGIGRYALALSFYVTLYGGDPDLITWYPTNFEKIGALELAAIRESVSNAAKEPMQLTTPSEWLLPTE